MHDESVRERQSEEPAGELIVEAAAPLWRDDDHFGQARSSARRRRGAYGEGEARRGARHAEGGCCGAADPGGVLACSDGVESSGSADFWA